MIILKIIGFVLLAVLGLILLIALAGLRITLGFKDEFYWRLSVCGIPLPQSLFTGRKAKKEKKAKGAKKSGGKRRKKTTEEESEKKPKRRLSDTLELIGELCGTVLDAVPKAFRIRLHRLSVTVGGEDAAKVAIGYGKYYAIIEGILALLDSYKGVFYGFFANRKKISLCTDYSGAKTKISFKLTISCFVWQLLFAAVRIGIKYILYTVNKDTRESSK